jgi:hypothetical protein
MCSEMSVLHARGDYFPSSAPPVGRCHGELINVHCRIDQTTCDIHGDGCCAPYGSDEEGGGSGCFLGPGAPGSAAMAVS